MKICTLYSNIHTCLMFNAVNMKNVSKVSLAIISESGSGLLSVGDNDPTWFCKARVLISQGF